MWLFAIFRRLAVTLQQSRKDVRYKSKWLPKGDQHVSMSKFCFTTLVVGCRAGTNANFPGTSLNFQEFHYVLCIYLYFLFMWESHNFPSREGASQIPPFSSPGGRVFTSPHQFYVLAFGLRLIHGIRYQIVFALDF